MMEKPETRIALWGCIAVFFIMAGNGAGAADAPVTQEQFLLLQQQNERLQQQLRKQQEVIDSLAHKVSEIHDVNASRGRELTDSKAQTKEGNETSPASSGPLHFGKV